MYLGPFIQYRVFKTHLCTGVGCHCLLPCCILTVSFSMLSDIPSPNMPLFLYLLVDFGWFLKFFLNFNWRLITLQYCVFHPEPFSHLPPHPIPQGHPSVPALSTLSHALNLDWLSVSHMIIYMFQCYSLKSFHCCLLPEFRSLFFTSASLLLSCI